ncbi:MAG: hypothetical protein IAE92_16380 [Burkholderiaceae bacterium]|nr:hypothetical protein [Burkholderiaceae bacterium]
MALLMICNATGADRGRQRYWTTRRLVAAENLGPGHIHVGKSTLILRWMPVNPSRINQALKI